MASDLVLAKRALKKLHKALDEIDEYGRLTDSKVGEWYEVGDIIQELQEDIERYRFKEAKDGNRRRRTPGCDK